MGTCRNYQAFSTRIFWLKYRVFPTSFSGTIGVGAVLENRAYIFISIVSLLLNRIHRSGGLLYPDLLSGGLGALNQRFGKNRFWLSSAIAFLKSTLRRNVFPVKLSRLLKILIPFCLCPLFVGFALGIPWCLLPPSLQWVEWKKLGDSPAAERHNILPTVSQKNMSSTLTREQWLRRSIRAKLWILIIGHPSGSSKKIGHPPPINWHIFYLNIEDGQSGIPENFILKSCTPDNNMACISLDHSRLFKDNNRAPLRISNLKSGTPGNYMAYISLDYSRLFKADNRAPPPINWHMFYLNIEDW